MFKRFIEKVKLIIPVAGGKTSEKKTRIDGIQRRVDAVDPGTPLKEVMELLVAIAENKNKLRVHERFYTNAYDIIDRESKTYRSKRSSDDDVYDERLGLWKISREKNCRKKAGKESAFSNMDDVYSWMRNLHGKTDEVPNEARNIIRLSPIWCSAPVCDSMDGRTLVMYRKNNWRGLCLTEDDWKGVVSYIKRSGLSAVVDKIFFCAPSKPNKWRTGRIRQREWEYLTKSGCSEIGAATGRLNGHGGVEVKGRVFKINK